MWRIRPVACGPSTEPEEHTLGVQDLPAVVVVALLASVVVAISRAFIDATRGVHGGHWQRALATGGVVGSIVAYGLATLSPLGMLGDAPGPGASDFPQNLNVVPVIDMLSTRTELLVVNLALLAPFGFLLRARWRSLDLRHVAMISLIAAVGIEGLQLSHPLRGSNIDDVILNVAGATAAAWVTSLLLRRLESDPERSGRAR